jgi:hypothetical protein
VSAETAPPRLPPVPPADSAAAPAAGADGFGPNSLGHRVPAVRTPSKIAAQVARLTMSRGPGEPPLIPEERLEALLRRLGDRLADAREERDSGEGAVRFRWHAGLFREFRANTDDAF